MDCLARVFSGARCSHIAGVCTCYLKSAFYCRNKGAMAPYIDTHRAMHLYLCGILHSRDRNPLLMNFVAGRIDRLLDSISW